MAHLVQPVVIEGTPLCCKHGVLLGSGRRWRTLSALYDACILAGVEDDDEWIMFETSGSGSLYGEFSFGVCCIWKFTLNFQLEPSGGDITGWIKLNGDIIENFERFGGTAGELISFEIDFNALGVIDRACGNVFDVFAEIDNGTVGISQFVTVTITGVAEGPPV